MSADPFPWGAIIHTFVLDMDGIECKIVKFHPFIYRIADGKRVIDNDAVRYFESSKSCMFIEFQEAIIWWMTNHNLGERNGNLAAGICRAMGVYEKKGR